MSSARRWAITAGVMTGSFIAALEATVVGTAMPTVIASLGGINHYSWVFSAYIVTSTVTVPVWGKLSDLYGRRLMYQLAIGVFLLGTLLSGFSDSMGQLITFRAIQGLGAGGLIPLGMTIIGDIFTLEERAKMQAYFSGVWGFSSVVGPVVGGFITDQISWRWVFFLNIPVGIVAATIIGFALKEPKVKRKPTIDYAGAALLMIAISLLMLAMVEGVKSLASIFAPINLLLFGISVALLYLFYRVEKRARDPIIPFDLLENRTVSASIIAGFLGGIGMFGAISFVPLFAQGALGMSATEAGSLLTPLMLSWVTMSVVGGRLLLKYSYRPLTIIGFGLLTVGFMFMAMFGTTTPRYYLYIELVIIGMGLGFTMLTLLIAVQQAVERPLLGVATSLNQFSRAIGGAFGVAAMGVALTIGLSTQLHKLADRPGSPFTHEQAEAFAENPNALIEPSAKSALPPETLTTLQNGMAAAIHPVFWVGALVSLLALAAAFMLPKRASGKESDCPEEPCGEKMIMAEQTMINARNQPAAD
jgi:EmrB/QacA subfamily drug resistance transporter